MNTENKIAYLAVTQKGMELAIYLQGLMSSGEVFVTEKLYEKQPEHLKSTCFSLKHGLKESMGELFKNYDYLICIMATGIVVRSIAPYVESKLSDPGVIVIDELGRHVISLLSGHVGGANEMSLLISQKLKADPVITTATDVNQKAALDNMAKQLNAYIEDFRESVKAVNYGLVTNEKIGLYIEPGIKERYSLDTRGFVLLKENQITKELQAIQEDKAIKNQPSQIHIEKLVYISNKLVPTVSCSKSIIQVIPREYVLGIGCKKDIATEHMLACFKEFMNQHGLSVGAIAQIGSIEFKKNEAAICKLAEYLGVPFKTFTRQELLRVESLFKGPEFVKSHIGVSCVAEPSAYLLSNGHLVVEKEKYQGITFALGKIMNA